MSDIYRFIPVWRRIAPTHSIRYGCFKNLSRGGFCVIAADFFHLPADQTHKRFQDENLIELFTEIEPNERCSWFGTLVEAIEHHDAAFGNK